VRYVAAVRLPSRRELSDRLLASHRWEDVRARLPFRLGRLVEGVALGADLASVRRWLGISATGPREVVELRLRQLHGERFRLRAGTADVWALPDTYLPPDHLPPPELDGEQIRLIWDLGANIGSSMAHMAVCYPHARIIGVELDADNAALCRENLAPWADRCELLHAAVWTRDGEVRYQRDGLDALSFRVQEDAGSAAAGDAVSPAWSLDTLLRRSGEDAVVDYVKMDVEGAEQQLLREHTGWAAQVRAIKVEVHEPYTPEACIEDLRRLGFSAQLDPGWRRRLGKPPVVGLRPEG
jgi:FkbM family methyltransferase